MPKLVIPVADTDSTISRLVVKSVIEQLLYSTEIEYIKDIVYHQRGDINATSQLYNSNETLRLEVNDLIEVDYKSTQDEDTFDFTKYQFEYPPIFIAKELGINIHPMHAKEQLTINFTYRSKSYDKLTTWLNSFRRKINISSPSAFHDIQYNYSIPSDLSAYLHQVYTLQETVAPYGITLRDFLLQNFANSGLVTRRNQSDTKQTLAMNVKNTGCLGMFTVLPEIQETGHEPPLSMVTFTYVIRYDRVTSLLLEYQKYIHNQVIDLQFINKYHDRRYHNNPHSGITTFSQSVNKATANQYGLLDYPDNGVYTGDGWYPKLNFEHVKSSQIIPIQMDLTNLRSVLDLNLLSTVGFPQWLLTLMGRFYSHLCTPYKWPYLFEVFEVNSKDTLLPVFVDSNFHLVSEIDMNPRNRYYIRITLFTFLFNVDFTDLYTEPATLLQLLQYINPKVTLDIIGNGSYATPQSVFKALNLINNSDSILMGLPTQMFSNLIVRRMTDATV